MAVTIRFDGGVEATIDGYEWTSNDESLAKTLNSLLSPNGPDTADPDPDYTAGAEAAKKFGAAIVRAHAEDDSQPDPDEVF